MMDCAATCWKSTGKTCAAPAARALPGDAPLSRVEPTAAVDGGLWIIAKR